MSEIRDRLRDRCERTQGRHATHFMVEDVEWLLAENDRLENDNLDLIARVDEAQERFPL